MNNSDKCQTGNGGRRAAILHQLGLHIRFSSFDHFRNGFATCLLLFAFSFSKPLLAETYSLTDYFPDISADAAEFSGTFLNSDGETPIKMTFGGVDPNKYLVNITTVQGGEMIKMEFDISPQGFRWLGTDYQLYDLVETAFPPVILVPNNLQSGATYPFFSRYQSKQGFITIVSQSNGHAEIGERLEMVSINDEMVEVLRVVITSNWRESWPLGVISGTTVREWLLAEGIGPVSITEERITNGVPSQTQKIVLTRDSFPTLTGPGDFQLLMPENESEFPFGQTPQEFRWQASAEADRYDVYFSKQGDSVATLVAEGVSTPVWRPDEPIASGKWYWHVVASNSIGTRTSETREFTINSENDGMPPRSFSLSNLGTLGLITIEGRPARPEEAFVQLSLLNGQLVGEKVPILDKGLFLGNVSLDGLSGVTSFMLAAFLHDSNQIVGYSEPFTVALGDGLSPIMSLPMSFSGVDIRFLGPPMPWELPDLLEGLPFPLDKNVYPLSEQVTRFDWSNVVSATWYDIYLSYNDPSANQLVAENLRTPSWETSEPLGEGKWYWKVVAHTTRGQETSPVWQFEVIDGVSNDPPELLKPSNESVHLISQPPNEFTWTALPGADSYDLLFTKQGDPEVSVWAEGLTDNRWVPERPFEQARWYWKVRANFPDATIESEVSNFEVLEALEVPGPLALEIPYDAEIFPFGFTPLDLRWLHSTNATRYEVLLGEKNNPDSLRVISKNLTNNHWRIQEDLEEGVWQWKVIAYNWIGERESSTREFHVVKKPHDFALQFPENEFSYSNGDFPNRFSWTSSLNATSYDVYLAKQGDNEAELVASGLKEPSWLVDRNITKGKWFWKIVARNVAGDTESNVWSFFAESDLTSIPDGPGNTPGQDFSFSVPVNILNSTDPQGGQVSISWFGVEGLRYRVQFKNSLQDSDWLSFENDDRIGSNAAQYVQLDFSESEYRFFRILAVGQEPKSISELDMSFLPIPAGKFMMGSSTEEEGRDSDEGPQTVVEISRPFWLGETEVTQAQWQTVMGTQPSSFTGDIQLPVEQVSWHDAMAYCEVLNEIYADRLPTGYHYTLPSEAQWEYACRATTETRFYFGDDVGEQEIAQYAWYESNSGSQTHPVGGKEPNSYGLFDMHGNVWEWCQDWIGPYSGGTLTDPLGIETGVSKVFRGGSWYDTAWSCRSAERDRRVPGFKSSNLGFRVAISSLPSGSPINIPELGLRLLPIRSGKFLMGSPVEESGRDSDEGPQTDVEISRPFWLGETEVTQAQWQTIMGVQPSAFGGDSRLPVEQVSWHDAVAFCQQLNQRYSNLVPAGYHFNLPTEAQWEYACRADTITRFYFGKDSDSHNLGQYAWYETNSDNRTQIVAGKLPNDWGLYDMYGNVWEWCRDWITPYAGGELIDPLGSMTGQSKVFRGGSWYDNAVSCRSAERDRRTPGFKSSNLGLRIALVPLAENLSTTIEGQTYVSGARVEFFDHNGISLGTTVTDDDGRYQFDLDQISEQGIRLALSGGELFDETFTGTLSALYFPPDDILNWNLTPVTTLVATMAMEHPDFQTAPFNTRNQMIREVADIPLIEQSEWFLLENEFFRGGDNLLNSIPLDPELNYETLIESIEREEFAQSWFEFFPYIQGGIIEASFGDTLLFGRDYAQTIDPLVSDESEGELQYELVSGPSGLTVDEAGNLLWPAENQQQPGSFPIKVKISNKNQGGAFVADGIVALKAAQVVAQGIIGPDGGSVYDDHLDYVLIVPQGAANPSTLFEIIVYYTDDRKLQVSYRTDRPLADESALVELNISNEVRLLSDTGPRALNKQHPRTAQVRSSDFDWVELDVFKGDYMSARVWLTNPLIGVNPWTPSHVKIKNRLPIGSPLFCPPDYELSLQEDAAVLEALQSWENIQSDEAFNEAQPVVFINGFTKGGGLPERDYWGESESNFLLQLQKIKNANGHYKYIVFNFRWRTNTRFDDAAADLGRAIGKIRNITGRNVHLVAHSFGGLLARSYLQNQANDYSYREDVEGLITMGTPHNGIFPSGAQQAINGENISFPKGFDGTAANLIGPLNLQLSGFQAGFSALPLFYINLMDSIYDDDLTTPGNLIYRLADLENNPLPVESKIIIGLKKESTGLTLFQVWGDGDGLISFEGQRFHPSLIDEQLAHSGINVSKDFPVIEKVIPEVAQTNTRADWSSRGYKHSSSLVTGSSRLNFIQSTLKGATPLQHEFFQEILDWIDNKPSAASPVEAIELSGRLVNAGSGHPIDSGGSVYLIEHGRIIDVTQINSQGQFKFNSIYLDLPGDLQLMLVADGFLDRTVSLQNLLINQVGNNQNQVEDLSLYSKNEQGVALVFQVNDAQNSSPVSDAIVRIYREDTLISPIFELVAGPDGKAESATLPNGSYSINISHPSFTSKELEIGVLHTRDGERKVLTIGMYKGISSPEMNMPIVIPSLDMKLVPIPADTFVMGSPNEEFGRWNDEGPLTTVTISRPFWMGETEVTQGQWQAVMGDNPSSFTGNDQLPVESVSWVDAMAFCRKLDELYGGALPSGYRYSLPTEAQWEYACRAGSQTQFFYGDDPSYSQLSQYAWYSGNSGSKTQPVGEKLPNRWELFDMLGNVLEWCADWYEHRYTGGSITDPQGPQFGSERVSRGGSWVNDPWGCRSADRFRRSPGYTQDRFGFRVAVINVSTQ